MGKRVDAAVKKLTDLTAEVNGHCTTLSKGFTQIEMLIGLVSSNNDVLAGIVKNAGKDAKGRPILTGEEDLAARLKGRQNWINGMHKWKADMIAAYGALTGDNTKDVAALIKILESLLVEKKGLNKKTAPAVEDALNRALVLEKKLVAMKTSDLNPANLPKLPD